VAKDRMTVAVSGLISEEIHNNSTAFLSDRIPLLGQLFRRGQATDAKRTGRHYPPVVMNTPAEAEAVSQTLLKDSVFIRPPQP